MDGCNAQHNGEGLHQKATPTLGFTFGENKKKQNTRDDILPLRRPDLH